MRLHDLLHVPLAIARSGAPRWLALVRSTAANAPRRMPAGLGATFGKAALWLGCWPSRRLRRRWRWSLLLLPIRRCGRWLVLRLDKLLEFVIPPAKEGTRGTLALVRPNRSSSQRELAACCRRRTDSAIGTNFN